jgi:hypothetical protein
MIIPLKEFERAEKRLLWLKFRQNAPAAGRQATIIPKVISPSVHIPIIQRIQVSSVVCVSLTV